MTTASAGVVGGGGEFLAVSQIKHVGPRGARTRANAIFVLSKFYLPPRRLGINFGKGGGQISAVNLDRGSGEPQRAA